MRNTPEDQQVLREVLEEFESRGYCRLVPLVGQVEVWIAGERAAQMEIQVVWDGRPGGDLRILVGLDREGWWDQFLPAGATLLVERCDC